MVDNYIKHYKHYNMNEILPGTIILQIKQPFYYFLVNPSNEITPLLPKIS